MRKNMDSCQHFSIRKLTVGAASVLIGVSFLGFNSSQVKADSVKPEADKNNDNIQKDEDASVTVDKNAATVDVKKQEQQLEVKKPVQLSVKKSDEDKQERTQTTDKDKSLTKSKEATPAKEIKADSQKASTKTTNQDKDQAVKDVKVASDAKNKKVNENDAAKQFNLNDWDKTVSDGDLTLGKYIGQGAETIYIPNAADVQNITEYHDIQKVIIKKDTITSLVGKTHNLTVSDTDDQKVYAQGDMSSAFQSHNNNWHQVDLTNLDTSGVNNMYAMFANEHDLTSVGDLSGWDTSNVVNMQFMFNDCPELTGTLNLSGWDLSSLNHNYYPLSQMFSGDAKISDLNVSNWKLGNDVTDIGGLFGGLAGVKTIDVTNMDLNKVTNAHGMFNGDSSLTTIKGLDTLKTNKVTNMSNMFDGDSSLAQLDLNNFDTTNVTDMSAMFQNCYSLSNLSGLSNWNISNVKSMNHMFWGVGSQTNAGQRANLDLSSWKVDPSKSQVYDIFTNAHFDSLKLSGWKFNDDLLRRAAATMKGSSVIDVTDWDTSAVDDMSGLFSDYKNTTSITGLDTWNIDNVKHMDRMFQNTPLLKAIISKWNPANSTEDNMFDGSAITVKDFNFTDNGLRSYLGNRRNDTVIDVTGFKTNRVTNLSNLFCQFGNLTEVKGLNTWNTSNVTNMGNMFSFDSKLTNLDLTGWDTSKVQYMDHMFYGDHSLAEIKGIENWDVSKVTNLSYMFDASQMDNSGINPAEGRDFGQFKANSSLTSLDLSKWNTASATNMEGLFKGQQNLTSVGNFNNWKTDKVTSISDMFALDKNLTFSDAACANMAKWNTSNVTTMRELFEGLEKQADLSFVASWKTGNVNDMSYMFMNDKALTNVGDLSGWDTSKVGTAQIAGQPEIQNYGFGLMFANCEKLPEIKGIEKWNVENVTKARGMFENTKALQSLDLSHWNTKNLHIAGEMFADSGVKSLDLSNWDFSNLKHFNDGGMLTGNALNHRGSEFMFLYLANPCTITMNNVKLPQDYKEGFDVVDFASEQPLVVISPELLTARAAKANTTLNNEEWHWSNGATQIGHQNVNYLTYYNKDDLTNPIARQKMNFVFASAKQLQSAITTMLLAVPEGSASVSNSSDFYGYLKGVTSVENVKKALGDKLASEWNYAKDAEDGYLLFNDRASLTDLISGKYQLTFEAVANIHYIDSTNNKEINISKQSYNTTKDVTGNDLVNSWSFSNFGWQLQSSKLPEKMGSQDGDYYVYLTAPDKTKTINEKINYVIDGKTVQTDTKEISFTQKSNGFDEKTLKPTYGNWEGEVASVTAPHTITNDGNKYDIDVKAAKANNSLISIDNNGVISIKVTATDAKDGQSFEITVPYVKESSETGTPTDTDKDSLQIVEFIDQANDKVVKEVTKSGKVGTTVDLDVSLPEGYVLAKGEKMPASSYKLTGEDKPVIVYVVKKSSETGKPTDTDKDSLQIVEFIDQATNQVVKEVSKSGKVGTTIDLDVSLPSGYELAPGQAMPKASYVLTGKDLPIIVYVTAVAPVLPDDQPDIPTPNPTPDDNNTDNDTVRPLDEDTNDQEEVVRPLGQKTPEAPEVATHVERASQETVAPKAQSVTQAKYEHASEALPQTGTKDNNILTLLGIGIAAVASIFGLGVDRKKK